MNSKLTGSSSKANSRANTAFGSQRKTFRVWNSFEAFKKFLKLSLVTLKAPKKGLSFSPWDYYWPWVLNCWVLFKIIWPRQCKAGTCLSGQALWLSDSHYYDYEGFSKEKTWRRRRRRGSSKSLSPTQTVRQKLVGGREQSLICSVSHNPLFSNTTFVLSSSSFYSEPQTENCVRNAPC